MMRQQTRVGKVHTIDPLLSKVCYKNCLNFQAKGFILGYTLRWKSENEGIARFHDLNVIHHVKITPQNIKPYYYTWCTAV